MSRRNKKKKQQKNASSGVKKVVKKTSTGCTIYYLGADNKIHQKQSQSALPPASTTKVSSGKASTPLFDHEARDYHGYGGYGNYGSTYPNYNYWKKDAKPETDEDKFARIMRTIENKGKYATTKSYTY